MVAVAFIFFGNNNSSYKKTSHEIVFENDTVIVSEQDFTNAQEVIFVNCKFEGDIFEALSAAKNLSKIELNGCEVKSYKGIEKLHDLTEFNMANCGIGLMEQGYIFDSLSKSSKDTLTKLELSFNSNMVKNNPDFSMFKKLTHLGLEDCGVFGTLKLNNNIKVLLIANTSISEIDCADLSNITAIDIMGASIFFFDKELSSTAKVMMKTTYANVEDKEARYKEDIKAVREENGMYVKF